MLVIDTEGEGTALGRMSIAQSTKDFQAHNLAAAAGIWGEIYIGRTGLIRDREAAAHIIREQLNLDVMACKWPSTRPGQAPNRSKINFKAMQIDGQDMKYPTVLRVAVGNSAIQHPIRYRLQEDKFPTRCKHCHQEVEQGCICEKVKEMASFNKNKRKEVADNARMHKENSREAMPRNANSNPARPTGGATTAEKLMRQRERRNLMAKAKERGICEAFAIGACKAANCPKGKHEEIH